MDKSPAEQLRAIREDMASLPAEQLQLVREAAELLRAVVVLQGKPGQFALTLVFMELAADLEERANG